MKVDLAWWLYAATCVVSWYGFGLFAWWWRSRGKASLVYAYVTLLLLGIALSTTGSIYVRYFKIIDPEIWTHLMGEWWWSARQWVLLISVVLIAGHMSYRVFYQRYRDD